MLCSTSICIFKSIVYILIRLTLCPGSDQDRLIFCSSQEGAWLGLRDCSISSFSRDRERPLFRVSGSQ